MARTELFIVSRSTIIWFFTSLFFSQLLYYYWLALKTTCFIYNIMHTAEYDCCVGPIVHVSVYASYTITIHKQMDTHTNEYAQLSYNDVVYTASHSNFLFTYCSH